MSYQDLESQLREQIRSLREADQQNKSVATEVAPAPQPQRPVRTQQDVDRRVLHAYVAREHPFTYLMAVSSGLLRVILIGGICSIFLTPFLLLALGVIVPAISGSDEGRTTDSNGVTHYSSGSTSRPSSKF